MCGEEKILKLLWRKCESGEDTYNCDMIPKNEMHSLFQR